MTITPFRIQQIGEWLNGAATGDEHRSAKALLDGGHVIYFNAARMDCGNAALSWRTKDGTLYSTSIVPLDRIVALTETYRS